jgi:hypothetical protein
MNKEASIKTTISNPVVKARSALSSGRGVGKAIGAAVGLAGLGGTAYLAGKHHQNKNKESLMNKEAMYRAFFEELNEIEKAQQFEKIALAPGAATGFFSRLAGGAGKILKAGKGALKDPTAAGRTIKGTYREAGGGLAGIGKVLDSPTGRAAALGGAATLAVPAAAGYVAGRRSGSPGYYR